MRLVMVEWEDSATNYGWHRLSTDDSISYCVSVGMICREDEKQVTLAQSRSDCGNISETISIPRSCIRRMRMLKIK